MERAIQLHSGTKARSYTFRSNALSLRNVSAIADDFYKVSLKRILPHGRLGFAKQGLVQKYGNDNNQSSHFDSTSHDTDDNFKDRYFQGSETFDKDISNSSKSHAVWSAKGGKSADICYQYTERGRCALVPCPGQPAASTHYRGFVRELNNTALSADVLANRTRGGCELCTIYGRHCLVSHTHRFRSLKQTSVIYGPCPPFPMQFRRMHHQRSCTNQLAKHRIHSFILFKAPPII